MSIGLKGSRIIHYGEVRHNFEKRNFSTFFNTRKLHSLLSLLLVPGYIMVRAVVHAKEPGGCDRITSPATALPTCMSEADGQF